MILKSYLMDNWPKKLVRIIPMHKIFVNNCGGCHEH